MTGSAQGVTVVDEVLLELGRPAAVPVRPVAAASAVIRGPWAGRGFVADPRPEAEAGPRSRPGC